MTMTLDGVNYDKQTLTDATTRNLTTGTSYSNSVGMTIKTDFTVGSLTQQQTWTWTDFQSIGLSTGNGNSMGVLLKTITPSCHNHVAIYEDKVYHAFAFQEQTGDTYCN